MQLCFNEMTAKKNGNLQDNIRLCRQYGFGQIEILKGSMIKWIRSGKSLEELKALLAQYDVKPASLNAVEGIGFNGKAGMRTLKELSHLLFYSCRALGCDTMEVIGTFGAPEADAEKVKEEVAASLAQVADVAANYGVKLALEFMAVPGSSVYNYEQCLEIIRRADRPNAGMLLDTWHFAVGGGKPEDLLKLNPGEVNMVHISDCPKCEPLGIPRTQSFWAGEGELDIAAMLKNLQSAGYNGAASVEVMSPLVHELPLEQCFETAARTTRAVLEAAGV